MIKSERVTFSDEQLSKQQHTHRGQQDAAENKVTSSSARRKEFSQKKNTTEGSVKLQARKLESSTSLAGADDESDNESASVLGLNVEQQRAALEEQLKHVSWTRKKQMVKDFEENFSKMKAAKNADPKNVIKHEFRQGRLSQFAANDLIRLYEVMEETESLSKLKIKNLQRIQNFNECLDLRRRDKVLKKKDFESYERKKDRKFSWQ